MCSFEEKNVQNFYIFSNLVFLKNSGDSPFKHLAEVGVNSKFKINIDDILVINDDLDINIGKYKLKANGSSGGHNGLKNIENNLETNKYKRLKIGISNDKNRDTKDYVLGKFSIEEKKILDNIIEKSENIINDFFLISFDLLMTKYNNN